MVDPSEKTWNTFIDLVLEWAPILKQIYQEQDEKDRKALKEYRET